LTCPNSSRAAAIKNEQNRIVSKLRDLMSLCDKLEAGLMRSQADSEKLIRAVVGRMLAE